jgi:dipeptidase E
MKLLLVSNSTLHGQGYLDHCAGAMQSFLGPAVRQVLFVPYALADRDAYHAKARARFEAMGLRLDSVHQAPDPRVAVAEAQAFFVGGGNTFRLLAELRRQGLIPALQAAVAAGTPYMGSSAGSNVACATIMTTNDMPIVDPGGFDALGLVPFQINPHYLDPAPDSTHMGETREERLRQYHEMNARPVVGLREGAWLVVEDGTVRLEGSTGARVFSRGKAPFEALPPTRLALPLE